MQYSVSYIPEAQVVSAAKANGWKEGDDCMLDFAPTENHYEHREFTTFEDALEFAKKRAPQDIFRCVRITSHELHVYECDGIQYDDWEPAHHWDVEVDGVINDWPADSD